MQQSKDNLPTTKLRALMILCALAVVSLLYIPLPLLTMLKQNYGIEAVIISSFGFAYALGFLIFGPLSDRLGRRSVMVGGLFALTIISITLAVVQSPVFLIIGRILQGFAAASFPPVAIAYLAERGTPQQRSWSVAWISTAFLSAGLLGQIYGGIIATRWGLGLSFLPLCGIYLFTLWQLLKIPHTKIEAPPLPHFWHNYRLIASLLADPKLRRVYIPALLLLMCFVSFYISLDAYLASQLAAPVSPLMARAIAAPAFLAPLLVAILMPKLGAKKLVAIGLACASLGLFLCSLSLIFKSHLFILLSASFIFVSGIGISVPSLIVRVTSISETAVRGLAVSLYTFILFIGASLAPYLAKQIVHIPLENIYILLAILLGSCAIYSTTGSA